MQGCSIIFYPILINAFLLSTYKPGTESTDSLVYLFHFIYGCHQPLCASFRVCVLLFLCL